MYHISLNKRPGAYCYRARNFPEIGLKIGLTFLNASSSVIQNATILTRGTTIL